MIKIIGSLLFSLVVSSCMADSVPIRQRVANHRENKSSQAVKNNSAYVSVDLIVDKQQVVVAESVPYTIRVVFDPQTTEVSQVTPPSITHARVDTLTGPVKRQRTIKNRHCMVYEWSGRFYPERPGALEVSPVQVEYVSKSEAGRSGSFMVGFFSAFDRSVNTIFSEPAHLQVEPLDRRVQKSGGFVGVISAIDLSVTTNEVFKDDAVIARLTIKGEGNLSQVSHPFLSLPKGFRLYASESHSIPGGKVFEYVLQAQEKGFFMIPVQQLYYFDTELQQVQNVRSDPTHITVRDGKNIQAAEDDLTRELSDEADQPNGEANHDLDRTAELENNQKKGPSLLRRMILPEQLFWAMMFFIALIGVVRECYANFIALGAAILQWYQRRMLFKKIRRILYADKKSVSGMRLYELFQKLQSRVDWNRVQHTSDQLSCEWEYCWSQLLTSYFGKDDSISDDFVQRAQRLLSELEKGAWFL